MGFFRCPWKCHDPAYPAKKWKTEEGFAKHLTECKAKPDPIMVRLPTAIEESIFFTDCPVCGEPIMTGQTVWQRGMKILCCYRCRIAPGNSYHSSQGAHLDCAGLILPDDSLD